MCDGKSYFLLKINLNLTKNQQDEKHIRVRYCEQEIV